MVDVGSSSSDKQVVKQAGRRRSSRFWIVLALGLVLTGIWVYYFSPLTRAGFLFNWPKRYDVVVYANKGGVRGADPVKLTHLGMAALMRTTHEIHYDPGYYEIDYPMGDVPPEIGVCADVIVRSYRRIGIDLQELIHEDMEARPEAYPRIWLNWKTDTNIDHRRVQNIAVFLLGRRAALSVDPVKTLYLPGDVVIWRMYNRRLHCGIVADEFSPGVRYRNIVHNIGNGPVSENVLLKWPVIGHFRWTGDIWLK